MPNYQFKFRYEFKATCPRCDRQLTSEDYPCKNCGKAYYKLTLDGAFIGCAVCGRMNSLTVGVKCRSCGAEIHRLDFNTGQKTVWTVGLVVMLGVIVVVALSFAIDNCLI